MIKLDPIELEKVKGDANSVAQALVKKAIEEEMRIRPFSEEELNALSEIKKNVEIEYFLNLLAQNKVTVSEVEVLEAYKNNLAAFGDKNVTDIYSQIHQLVFNQKLGAEKATIVNNLVTKYGLNDILKEYVPELKNLGKDENKTEFPTKVAPVISSSNEKIFDGVATSTSEEMIAKPFVEEKLTKADPYTNPVTSTSTVESIVSPSPFVLNEEPLVKESVPKDFIIKEEPVKAEIFQSELLKEEPVFDTVIPEPFIVEDRKVEEPVFSPVQEETIVKNEEILSTPFVAQEETPSPSTFSGEKTNLFEAPQVVNESESQNSINEEKKSELLEEKDSSNEPFAGFGSFNFKFD